jgi:2-phosphoglycerate kinase
VLSGDIRVILIGGTSHAGKSKVAQVLAEQLGWECRSTDKLARHPGRPWSTPTWSVPPHVMDHYLRLPVDELLADVCRHYRDNVAPLIRQVVATSLGAKRAPGLVLEGSAILPEIAAALLSPGLIALVLTMPSDALAQRMRISSDYDARTALEKEAIDKFIARALAFDKYVIEQAKKCAIPMLEIHPHNTLDEVVRQVRSLVGAPV